MYGLYHFLSSLDLESVIPIQIDIQCAVMTENVMTFLFSMFITYVMSFVTVWCFQGMIALRRGATELQHEDYMDAILEVQAKKKTNLQYYAWESDTSIVSYDVLRGLLALTDQSTTRCLIQTKVLNSNPLYQKFGGSVKTILLQKFCWNSDEW